MKKIIIKTICIISLGIQVAVANPLLKSFNEPISFYDIINVDLQTGIEIVIDNAIQIKNEIVNEQELRTFDNTLLKIDKIYAEVERVWSPAYLLANVSTDKSIRETSLDISERMSQFITTIQQDQALYEAVIDYASTEEAIQLTGYKKKFLSDTLLGFERSGLGLSDEDKATVATLNHQITALGLEFNKNIRESDPFIIVTEKDMLGLSDHYKQERRLDDGRYKLDTSYPTYFPFMKLSQSETARKKLYATFKNRAKDKNIDVLQQLLKRRQQLSHLLNYASYAAYVTEVRMVQDPKTVWRFEKNLLKKVRKKAKKDVDLMKRIKSKDTGKKAKVIHPWEAMYYENEVKKTYYALDSEEVKQYFEYNNVTNGLFDIYQHLFDITFLKVTNPSVWNQDVSMYEVIDNQTKQVIGRFYLDMFPRENKYHHAAAFSIISGRQTERGYQLPTYALVCNFPKPSLDQPSLLTHSEVETYFHEFGHLVHGLLTTSPLISFSGTSVKRDFVEAPSQMLENWVWQEQSLQLFATHYQTDEVISKELIEKMAAAKNVNSGTKNLQQIYYATLDFTLHDRYDPWGKKTTTQVVAELQNKITLYPYLEGTHFQASFGHLVGYAASYYGYKWSEVYAADMFSIFEAQGIMNEQTGAHYRKTILEPGGMKEPLELVTDFLGRPSNNKAFIKSLGL